MSNKIILLFIIYFLFSPSLNNEKVIAYVDGDTIPVYLGVEGCNNNGICEAGTGETFATCPNDCFAPTSSPTTTSGSKPNESLPIENIIPLQNPYNVRAVVNVNGINIFWSNPDNDFSYIRVMRNVDRFHGDPFIGKLIYEGRAENFFDKNVIPGKKYFYTLFSRYSDGKFSSGAAVSATAFSFTKITPPTTEPIVPEVPITPTTSTDIENLLSLRYFVHQYGHKVQQLSSAEYIIIDNNQSTTIDTEELTHHDDFLTITNAQGKKFGQYMFSFNDSSGRFESVIPPLEKLGLYNVNIYRYEYNVPKLIKKGMLYTKIGITHTTVEPDANYLRDLIYAIIFILVLFILLFVLKRRRKTQ